MSKHPNRSRHRVPTITVVVSDPISDRYQIEVDMSTQRLERRYCKAVKALEAAQRRAERAQRRLQARQVTKRAAAQREYDTLLLIVEDRRRELHEIELLMMPIDYGGRDTRRRHVRHEAGAITIPLGATTGEHQKTTPTPIFPVISSKVRST